MEAVSLESLPPEDSDLYIPNLSDVQVQTPCSESALQSMHMSAIRYTPSAATSAAPIPPPLLAAQTPGSLIQGIYRTTFTTQVIAAQTFHYPPTPPIDGSSSDRREKHHLQQTDVEGQVIAPINLESELPASAGLDKPPVNPFPSPLPTPPDVESLHQHSRSAPQHQRPVDDVHSSVAKMASPAFSGAQQQWSAHQAANICFMPQQQQQHGASSCGAQLVPYSATSSVGGRRGCPPPAPVPALQQMCYSASAVSSPLPFNDPRCGISSMGEMLKKIPVMPALVKDGELLLFHPCIFVCFLGDTKCSPCSYVV